MAAAAHNWQALQYATDELRADREIVQIALAQHHSALERKSYVMWHQQNANRWRREGFPSPLMHASEKLRNDKGIVLAAVTHEGVAALRYA
eukprot:COSAG01_NODE_47790_length_387_cov_0.548611_1_plen_90_part_10